MSKHNTRVYRIGIDARFYRNVTGGIGRYTRNLLSHIAKIDSHNQYFVFITENDTREWISLGANFTPVVTGAAHYSVAEQTTFLKDLYLYRLDLVHFLNFNHPIFYWKPFISTLHDFTVYFFPTGRQQTNKLRRKAFIYVLKHSLTAASAVLAISQNSAKDAREVFNIPDNKIRVVYEGRPKPVNITAAQVRSAHEYLNTFEPYFLFVSQWRPHKGIITLVEAFDLFKQQTDLPHKLVLAGKQDYSHKHVQEAIGKSSCKADIIAPGFVPEELLGALYHASTAYVLPSLYEGFGLMLLEAFAFGAPAISSNNSSLPEVGGEGALYFPTGDARALADQLEQLAKKPKLRDEILEKGKAQLKKFSWERCATETLKVYNEVLIKQK